MLRPVSLVAQWQGIRSRLGDGWSDARLALRIEDAGRLAHAAALLGPLAPGLAGRTLQLVASRGGAGPSPAAVERALARIDQERIGGELTLVSAGERGPAARRAHAPGLADQWDGAVAELPSDWTDLYCEIELTSSDHLEPAALALAPLNPARFGATTGFRFRCARRFGYGASPGMARRCLSRLDERGIPGQVRVLRALSDTKPVATQGPVWYLGGKVV